MARHRPKALDENNIRWTQKPGSRGPDGIQELSLGGGKVKFASICLMALALLGEWSSSTFAGNDLPRRPFLGVRLEAADHAVKIVHIFPNSSGSRSDLKMGDVVLAINQTKVTSVVDFLSTMKRFHTGDRVKCQIARDGKESVIELPLTEWPREAPADFDIIYDSVPADDATLRSIVTKPKAARAGAKVPAVLYIQGIDCGSIEAPMGGTDLSVQMVYELTRSGFAVMRCDKSGVGDSTGKSCADLGLQDEVAQFVSAIRKLKTYDFVDRQKIFLFGHSAGGWVAPLAATKEPVQGITTAAFYGKRWMAKASASAER